MVPGASQSLHPPEAGAPQAAQDLLPLVYEELRQIAKARMANEKPGQTLQATALVHEAWLRLSAHGERQFANRRHFFKAAAETMQRILVDIARRKQTAKHGGNCERDELNESCIAVAAPSDEMLAVDEALVDLAKEDPVAAEVVQLRYFVGMTVPEIAAALEMAPRTVDRHWSFARAWLKRRIRAELSGRP